MAEIKQRVLLVQHTADPQALVSLAARLCYAGSDMDALLKLVSEKDQNAFLEKIMQMGHESVLEHASFTFMLEGVSRAFLAQVTRHRIASFSVQSQRYVSYEKGFDYVIPPAIVALGEDALSDYHDQMAQMQSWYDQWQERLGKAGEKSNEDARFVLPNACATRMQVTMNARELRHFFALRMCTRAQWEIRAVANQMFEQCYKVAPAIFRDAGPGCLRGACPEGSKTCGKQAEMKTERKEFLNSGQAVTNI